MKHNLRVIGMVLSMATLVMVYHASMTSYLRDLDKPLILEVGFMASFAIACSYEFKNIDWRFSFVGCVATGAVFVAGTLMATWLRAEYVGMLSQIKDNVELAEFIGRDLHEALAARYVGYGGCFAIGLLLARLALNRMLRKVFTVMFIPLDERPVPCPCCGQLVAGNAVSAI